MIPPPFAIEPELLGTLPRNVRITFRTQIGRVITLALIFGVAVLMQSCANTNLTKLHALENHGKYATAKVISKSQHKSRGSISYNLDYKYLVDAVPYTSSKTVQQDEYNNTPIGTRFSVTYLPEEPDYNHIGPVTNQVIYAAIAGWICMGIFTVGIFVGIELLNESSVRSHRKLIREGVPVQAMVVDKHSSRDRYYSSTYWITCSYWAGQQAVTKQFNVSFQMFTFQPVGSSFTVLYLPSSPYVSLPYRTITDVNVVKGWG